MENSFIDLIIRIKNSYLTGNQSLISPHSNFKEALTKKLKELGYVNDYRVEGETIKEIIIDLKYNNKEPVITGIEIISKPGRRQYMSYKALKPIVNNFGYSILSTSKGILTNKEARKMKLGGELLFNIW